MNFSIVTPTYNRKHCIKDSVMSSLHLIRQGIAKELIIVDDASSDGTTEFLEVLFKDSINDGILKLVRLDENLGVTGAKNRGAEIADGDWIIFMDSDDCFYDGITEFLIDDMPLLIDYDIIFCRCIDHKTKQLIGRAEKAKVISFNDALNGGIPGECLPILKRKSILEYPYNTELRGCESLAYLNILHSGGAAYLSERICRVYDSNGQDRLCTKENIIKRSDKLAKYNLMLLRFYKGLGFKQFIGILLRVIYYSLHSLKREIVNVQK